MHRVRGLTGPLLAALVAAGTGSPAHAGSGYIWPIPIKPALSATFGETRSTAFHMGMDVKTWGKTGYEVRAIADGQVIRVRTSPWGYGRAVYQQLADGRIAVYAHLESFAPQIDAHVRQAQQASGTYTVNLWFEGGELPVKQGQVLARTGQSGAGPPHLHLELRTADHVPINPLTNGYRDLVRDTEAPTIRQIVLSPVGVESTVDGEHGLVPVPLRWKKATRRYENAAPVLVHGRIRASVLTHDRADGVTNKLAPYRHVLLVDGKPVFGATYDRVSYADAHQVALDRLRLTDKANDAHFSLFRAPGSRLSFYDSTGSDGLLRCGVDVGSGAGPRRAGTYLETGRHELEVVAADVYGNESRARIILLVDAPPRIVEARLVPGRGGLFLEAGLRDPDDEFVDVTVERQVRDGWKRVEQSRLVVGSGPFTWRLAEETGVWRLRVRDEAGATDGRVLALRGEAEDLDGRRPNRPQRGLQLELDPVVHGDFVELRIRTSAMLKQDPAVRATVEVERQRRGPLARLRTMTRTARAEWVLPRQVSPTEYVALVPFGGTDTSETAAPPQAVLVVDVGATSERGAAASEWMQLAHRRVAPGRAAILDFDDGQAILAFAAGSAYEPLYPQAVPFNPEGAGELEPTPVGFAFGPADVPFDRAVTVTMAGRGAPIGQLGIYAENKKGGWVFLGNEVTADSAGVRTSVRQLGRLAVLADHTPPEISQVRPADGSRVKGRRPRLSAHVVDQGSGLGREEDILMELNGRRLISVYDPDADRVEYEPREDLAPGPYELVVRVRDRCGNEAANTVRFEVR